MIIYIYLNVIYLESEKATVTLLPETKFTEILVALLVFIMIYLQKHEWKHIWMLFLYHNGVLYEQQLQYLQLFTISNVL